MSVFLLFHGNTTPHYLPSFISVLSSSGQNGDPSNLQQLSTATASSGPHPLPTNEPHAGVPACLFYIDLKLVVGLFSFLAVFEKLVCRDEPRGMWLMFRDGGWKCGLSRTITIPGESLEVSKMKTESGPEKNGRRKEWKHLDNTTQSKEACRNPSKPKGRLCPALKEKKLACSLFIYLFVVHTVGYGQ